MTSGTTGYFPNSTETIEIMSFHEEWKNLGKTCVDDKNNNSFHSQFSSVFKYPFKDNVYIALGDRWLTDLPENLPDIPNVFEELFDDKKEKTISIEELRTFTDENTSEANYVWLPIEFDEKGNPHIKWKTEWKL